LIIGEKGVKFKEDDYILAAINIYLDVIMLFLKILSIFGKEDNTSICDNSISDNSISDSSI
jgi:hypothetical protein